VVEFPGDLRLLIGPRLGLVAGYVGGKINTRSCAPSGRVLRVSSGCWRSRFRGGRAWARASSTRSFRDDRVFVPQITRVAESVTTGLRNMDFVEAARASAPAPSPSCACTCLATYWGPIFVYATGLISVSMILAAGLSFLGLVQNAGAGMGLDAHTLRTAIYINPWVAALPGVMIFAVSICFNLLTMALRSAMDIRNDHERDSLPQSICLSRSRIAAGAAQPLLQVDGLTKTFPGARRSLQQAQDSAARWMKCRSRIARAKRSGSSASPAAASRPPRGC